MVAMQANFSPSRLSSGTTCVTSLNALLASSLDILGIGAELCLEVETDVRGCDCPSRRLRVQAMHRLLKQVSKTNTPLKALSSSACWYAVQCTWEQLT
jgi:hypothetical protein